MNNPVNQPTKKELVAFRKTTTEMLGKMDGKTFDVSKEMSNTEVIAIVWTGALEAAEATVISLEDKKLTFSDLLQFGARADVFTNAVNDSKNLMHALASATNQEIADARKLAFEAFEISNVELEFDIESISNAFIAVIRRFAVQQNKAA